MDKYRRIPRPKEPQVDGQMKISFLGSVKGYVAQAAKIFNEDNSDSLLIKATGNAIVRAVSLAEVLKRRIPNLHQVTTCGSLEITDEFEPLEEGLDNVSRTRIVPFMELTLARGEAINVLNKEDPGYQGPVDQSLIKDFVTLDSRSDGENNNENSDNNRVNRGGGDRNSFRGSRWRGGRGRGDNNMGNNGRGGGRGGGNNSGGSFRGGNRGRGGNFRGGRGRGGGGSNWRGTNNGGNEGNDIQDNMDNSGEVPNNRRRGRGGRRGGGRPIGNDEQSSG